MYKNIDECLYWVDDNGVKVVNVNSDFSFITMRRVAIVFFELGGVKNFMQKLQDIS